MAEATATDGPASGNPAAVGGSPLGHALRHLAVVGLGIPFVLWLIAPGSGGRPGDGQWFALILLPALIIWPLLGFRALGILVAAGMNQRTWSAARAAVERGDVRPDVVVRNGMGTGMLVLDEGARRLFLNGETYGFDEVRRLETVPVGPGFWNQFTGVPKLRLSMARGHQPVQDVGVANNAVLQQTLARVGNLLGFQY